MATSRTVAGGSAGPWRDVAGGQSRGREVAVGVVGDEAEPLVEREGGRVVASRLEVRRARAPLRRPLHEGGHHHQREPLPPVVRGHPHVGDPGPVVGQRHPPLRDERRPVEHRDEADLGRPLEHGPRSRPGGAAARASSASHAAEAAGSTETDHSRRVEGFAARTRRVSRVSPRGRAGSAEGTGELGDGGHLELRVGLARAGRHPAALHEGGLLVGPDDHLGPGRQPAGGVEVAHRRQRVVERHAGGAHRQHRVRPRARTRPRRAAPTRRAARTRPGASPAAPAARPPRR